MMAKINRRKFIKKSVKAGTAASVWSALIEKALAVDAHSVSGSIRDVEHIVILMQENRSFDHYFGTLKGVRGYGDRFPIPLESGRRVFEQSDGSKIIPPYRADKSKSNAAFVKGTPHDFPDMQAAWNQGKYGFWPLFKTPYSMAYYTREEIPFQCALAEAFTISDAYYCTVATGTDPNRIVFWSGSNFDPEKRAAGVNCTDEHSEPVNLRCWPEHDGDTGKPGRMPDPGYTYRGNDLTWPTIPDVLEKAGISWRIYQDPNDNWDGAMHGCLAFKSFREAKPGSPIYENGMRHWSLDDLKEQVRQNKLPQVSWVLPSQKDSEHPNAPSSPYRGADFTHKVLEALVSNPEVWSKTVFFLTFDENDGLFDHLPAPAVPSLNLDGTPAGKSTLGLEGMYFNNHHGTAEFPNPFHKASMEKGGPLRTRVYQDKRDTISGNVRPWGMGPRVPMYIISPWSKGGWVDSQVADHTSVGQFLEKRFGVRIPAISPWHRAVSSDLLSAFDFATPNDPVFPRMPETSHYAELDAASRKLPVAAAPPAPAPLYQEKGTRYSRALPYKLHTEITKRRESSAVRLTFRNEGEAGVVFHVYDLLHLDRIPRRYTVGPGKTLSDDWLVTGAGGIYDLEVYGPNGYFHKFSGKLPNKEPLVYLRYDHRGGGLAVRIANPENAPLTPVIVSNVYGYQCPEIPPLKPGGHVTQRWLLEESGNWYDFSVQDETGFLHRFSGRVETGKPAISDPAMAIHLES